MRHEQNQFRTARRMSLFFYSLCASYIYIQSHFHTTHTREDTIAKAINYCMTKSIGNNYHHNLSSIVKTTTSNNLISSYAMRNMEMRARENNSVVDRLNRGRNVFGGRAIRIAAVMGLTGSIAMAGFVEGFSVPVPRHVSCVVSRPFYNSGLRSRLSMSSTPQEDRTEEERKEDASLDDVYTQKSFRLGDKKEEGIWKAPRLPPLLVEESQLLVYDVMLLLNLSVSISFWVTHRMDFSYLLPAFSEGSMLSVCWILAGLYNGAFLYSAVDGHLGGDNGGPRGAGRLAFGTFLTATNLRLVIALLTAVLGHRTAFSGAGEELIPLEIGVGMALMTGWRMLHSSYVSRM